MELEGPAGAKGRPICAKCKTGSAPKNAIGDALAEKLRPNTYDLGIESESDLKRAALETRIKLIDLNGDGVFEVVAQGMIGCGATGNCAFWVLRDTKEGYEIILEGTAQTITIQPSTSNGFRDIVLSTHGPATSGGLTLYQYNKKGFYEDVGSCGYDWTVLEGDKVRELKEPRITPCR